MLQLIYILFLLIVINFYLKIRNQNQLQESEKFMISLMSIGILFILFYTTAYLCSDKLTKMMNPTFNVIFIVAMNLIMPVITTEIVLHVYSRFMIKKGK